MNGREVAPPSHCLLNLKTKDMNTLAEKRILFLKEMAENGQSLLSQCEDLKYDGRYSVEFLYFRGSNAAVFNRGISHGLILINKRCPVSDDIEKAFKGHAEKVVYYESGSDLPSIARYIPFCVLNTIKEEIYKDPVHYRKIINWCMDIFITLEQIERIKGESVYMRGFFRVIGNKRIFRWSRFVKNHFPELGAIIQDMNKESYAIQGKARKRAVDNRKDCVKEHFYGSGYIYLFNNKMYHLGYNPLIKIGDEIKTYRTAHPDVVKEVINLYRLMRLNKKKLSFLKIQSSTRDFRVIIRNGKVRIVRSYREIYTFLARDLDKAIS